MRTLKNQEMGLFQDMEISSTSSFWPLLRINQSASELTGHFTWQVLALEGAILDITTSHFLAYINWHTWN